VPIYLLVYIQLAEDLSRIQKVLVVKDPRNRRRVSLSPYSRRPTQKLLWGPYSDETYFLALNANRGRLRMSASQ
jgi:hypothetical protein